MKLYTVFLSHVENGKERTIFRHSNEMKLYCLLAIFFQLSVYARKHSVLAVIANNQLIMYANDYHLGLGSNLLCILYLLF